MAEETKNQNGYNGGPVFDGEVPAQGDFGGWYHFFKNKIEQGEEMSIPQLQILGSIDRSYTADMLTQYFRKNENNLTVETIAEITKPLNRSASLTIISYLNKENHSGLIEKIKKATGQNDAERFEGYCDAVLEGTTNVFFDNLINLQYKDQSVNVPDREDIISEFMGDFCADAAEKQFYKDALVGISNSDFERIRATFDVERFSIDIDLQKKKTYRVLETASKAQFTEIISKVKPEYRQYFLDEILKNYAARQEEQKARQTKFNAQKEAFDNATEKHNTNQAILGQKVAMLGGTIPDEEGAPIKEEFTA